MVLVYRWNGRLSAGRSNSQVREKPFGPGANPERDTAFRFESTSGIPDAAFATVVGEKAVTTNLVARSERRDYNSDFECLKSRFMRLRSPSWKH